MTLHDRLSRMLRVAQRINGLAECRSGVELEATQAQAQLRAEARELGATDFPVAQRGAEVRLMDVSSVNQSPAAR